MSISKTTKLTAGMKTFGLFLAASVLCLAMFGCSKGADDLLNNSLAEIKSGNIMQAIQTLESLIENHGDSSEAAIAHWYLSQCYWKTQQFDKSIESLQMAKAKTSPAEPEAIIKLQFELMGKYFALKRYDEGEKAAAVLLENPDPDVVIGANIQLIVAKMAQEKYDEAKTIAEPLTASDNVQLKRQAYMYLANIHTKTEEYDLARKDYDALITSATQDKDPKEEEQLMGLSPEEREKKINDLVISLEFEKIITYGSAKDFDTAIKIMREFAEKNDGHEYEAIANIAIGDFQTELKDTLKAEKSYQVAADKYLTIGASQEDVERQAGLKLKSGEVYMLKMNKPEKAKEIFNEVLEKYAATRWAGKAQQLLSNMDKLAEITEANEAAAAKAIEEASAKTLKKAEAAAEKEKISGSKSDGYDEK
jgi:tetratricopeptide (TPR) repeat protein